MRLTIQRKLIGTLVLVGLIPLGISLIIISVGAAVMRVEAIGNDYEKEAARAAHQLALRLSSELSKLSLISRLNVTVEFVRQHQKITMTQEEIDALDHLWPDLGKDDPRISVILNNPMADQLSQLAQLDERGRNLFITNTHGIPIAACLKPDDFRQDDEAWWQITYNNGEGQGYISNVEVGQTDHQYTVELAVPIYDDTVHPRRVIGILKDKVDISVIQAPLLDAENLFGTTAQLYDLTTQKTAYALRESPLIQKSQREYRHYHQGGRRGLIRPLVSNLIMGTAIVPIDVQLQSSFLEVAHPNWMIIVSKPTLESIQAVYTIVLAIAVAGGLSIIVIFLFGVWLSKRHIIAPIRRLRDAIAAVGRGELNIRVLGGDSKHDHTFQEDEFGDLARGFDDMTRELQKNVGQLERSNETKLRFMALAGHELRTPVTYILGVCGLAQRQAHANEESKKSEAVIAFGKIADKAQRLNRIIENLLKLVHNDQFTTKLNKQPFDIRALVLQVCNEQQPFVNERKQQMLVNVAENIPMFDGDRDRLEDVLTNLISNAIRFSPDGGTIRVSARPIEGDMLELLIEDSGPGISEENLSKLFEPFYTGSDTIHHHSGTYEYGSKGIGLGLAVVRRFVETHDGIVRAYSSEKGTRFHILLPLPSRDTPIPTNPPLPPPPSPPPSHPLSPPDSSSAV